MAGGRRVVVCRSVTGRLTKCHRTAAGDASTHERSALDRRWTKKRPVISRRTTRSGPAGERQPVCHCLTVGVVPTRGTSAVDRLPTDTPRAERPQEPRRARAVGQRGISGPVEHADQSRRRSGGTVERRDEPLVGAPIRRCRGGRRRLAGSGRLSAEPPADGTDSGWRGVTAPTSGVVRGGAGGGSGRRGVDPAPRRGEGGEGGCPAGGEPPARSGRGGRGTTERTAWDTPMTPAPVHGGASGERGQAAVRRANIRESRSAAMSAAGEGTTRYRTARDFLS